MHGYIGLYKSGCFPLPAKRGSFAAEAEEARNPIQRYLTGVTSSTLGVLSLTAYVPRCRFTNATPSKGGSRHCYQGAADMVNLL